MTDNDPNHRHELALFRYGLIADLVHLPPATKGLYRRLEEKAAGHYLIPGTSRTRVAAETLRDWLKRYRQGGFNALMPKARADRGRSRRLPPEGLDCLLSIKEANPKLSGSPSSRPVPQVRCPMNCLYPPPLSIGCWSAMA